jgi:hypothetical protein
MWLKNCWRIWTEGRLSLQNLGCRQEAHEIDHLQSQEFCSYKDWGRRMLKRTVPEKSRETARWLSTLPPYTLQATWLTGSEPETKAHKWKSLSQM